MMICMCVIEPRLNNVNVALRRPAWQISIHCDQFGCHSANRGNDGQTTKKAHGQRSCVHSKRRLNPWWVVDLGLPLYVDGVNLTSRGDCCGQ